MSLRLDDVGVIRHAVMGSYKLSFGQGLLLGQGRYLPKGTDPVEGAGLFVSGIRPVTSSSEYGFMKGGASTFGYKSLELTAFYSRNRLDAAISREGMATSLSTTGFHRTLTERERKDNLLEETEGANLHYRHRASSFTATVGGTLLSYRYDRPVEWLASSRARTAESLEAAVVFNSFSVFGETAFSHDPHAVSWISGVQAHLTPDVSAVASIRHYDERYYSPFAGAFAERGDDGSNEEGYYVGIDAKLLKNLKVSTSYDIFRFPDLGSSITLPADGHDGRLYVTWEQTLH